MTQNREKADRAIMERLIRHLYERPQDREEMLRQIGEKNPALTGCRSVFVLKTAEDRGESVDDYRSIVQQLTFDMIGHDPVEVYSFYDRENLILVYFNLGSMEFPFLARVGEQKNRIEAGGLQVMIGVSCVHKSLSDLEKAFEEADNAFRYARYLGETEVVSSSDVEFAGSAGEESKKDYDTIIFEFRAGQYDECREYVKEYIGRIRAQELRPELYVQSCWELVHLLQIMLNEAGHAM